MSPTTDPRHEADARRQRARRTALWIAVVAVGIYVAFLLSAVMAQ